MWHGQISHLLATPSDTHSIAVRHQVMASAGSDESVHIWNLRRTEFIRWLRAGSVVNSVAISSDYRCIIAGCEDGIIRLWDEFTGRLAAECVFFGGAEWAMITAENCWNGSTEATKFLQGPVFDAESVRAYLNMEQGNKSCRCHLYARRGLEYRPDSEKEKEWIEILKCDEGSVDFLDKEYYNSDWYCLCKICSRRWFVNRDEFSHKPLTWQDVTSNKEYDWVFEPKAPSGLIEAATNGDIETIKRLLAEGTDVDERSFTSSPVGFKATALMFAVYFGQPACVELLLEAGADPNAKSAEGNTPLILTAKKREDLTLTSRLRDEGIDLRVARMLLQKGADPAAKNNKGESALPLSCHFRYYPELVKLLAEAAGPQAVTAPQPMHNALNPPHKETIELLLDLGVDVNMPTWVGRTPLMDAVCDIWFVGDNDRRKEIAELLLKRGADVHLRDSEENTALMIAARGKSAAELLTLLLNLGADVNARNKRGETALNVASFSGRKENVEVLLTHGASVEAADSNQSTPLLQAAGYSNNTGLVKLLLDRGANIEARNANFGETPLILAAKSLKTEMVTVLLGRGANINGTSSYNGHTALMKAAMQRGSEEMVELLIRRGADVNIADLEGQTALMKAAWSDSLCQVVKLLLDQKANVDAKNKHGETALDIADRHNQRAVAQLISDYKKK